MPRPKRREPRTVHDRGTEWGVTAEAEIGRLRAEVERLRSVRATLIAACKSERDNLADELLDCVSPGTRQSLGGRIESLDAAIREATDLGGDGGAG
jgi:hypothetical protein